MPVDRTSKLEQQHRRLLDGLAASIRQKGLSRTQVSDIVGHARASRRTFYKHFPDKDSCLVELVHRSATTIIECVAAATESDAPLATQIDQAVDAYLSVLSGEPELALALSSPAVGERIIRAQREEMERFAAFLVALTPGNDEGGKLPAPISMERAYMLASGFRATALRAIERGDGVVAAGREGKAIFKAILGADTTSRRSQGRTRA